MTVKLRALPSFDDILAVVRNMRECDREEIYATQWNDDPALFAERVYAVSGFCWVAWLDGRPAAVVGAAPERPNVYAAFAFGTDEWPRVVLSVTRHIRRFMIPALINAGCHRVSCASHAHHTEAHKWLERLGAEREAVHPGYGRGGETFFLYVWKRPADVHCPEN